MNDKTVFPKQLQRGLWIACGGLLAGAGLYAGVGSAALWAVAVLAVCAVAAGMLAGRRRAILPAPEAAKDDLPGLSPLARAVIDRLPDPLMLVDGGGRVLLANRAMHDIVGVEAERKHVSALLRTPGALEALAHTSATGESRSVEFAFHVPVERTFQAYTARAGEGAVTMLLLHDLTAVKRAEQMRADFIANASHELRTPLAAVSGFIETLKGPARDDVESRDKFLDIMQVEADRMRRLINDLLSLTRIEVNEHVAPQGEVALGDLAQAAVAALSPLAEADGIRIAVNAEPDLPHVAGERDELIQLLQNLIHNAIKYGREKGQVTVSLRQVPGAGRGGAMVAAAISDDGEGIAQEAIPRLTERFYRVDVKRSREKGGTGLGLAIVKHIVNRHGGRLQIESKPGAGSTFTVFLPVAKKTPDAPVT
jgi:two-component system, OmpR family, phosphate regulon sensor histidine kinase PhoR